MVWGGICLYIRDVLQEHVVPFTPHIGENFLLMHDNAHPHKSRCVSDFLNVVGIRAMAWPACSPDINPIEHVWDMLGRRLRSITPAVQNPEQVATALVEIWDNLLQDMIDNVIRSMRRRMTAVITRVTKTILKMFLLYRFLYSWCFESLPSYSGLNVELGWARTSYDRWRRRILEWTPRIQAHRNRGRPPTKWNDDIKRIVTNWIPVVEDRTVWTDMREAYVQQWTSGAIWWWWWWKTSQRYDMNFISNSPLWL